MNDAPRPSKALAQLLTIAGRTTTKRHLIAVIEPNPKGFFVHHGGTMNPGEVVAMTTDLLELVIDDGGNPDCACCVDRIAKVRQALQLLREAGIVEGGETKH